jgi:hypothetical protein
MAQSRWGIYTLSVTRETGRSRASGTLCAHWEGQVMIDMSNTLHKGLQRGLKSQGEIEGLIAQARVELYSGGRHPHLSFEQGVLAALEWVTGRGAHPFEE